MSQPTPKSRLRTEDRGFVATGGFGRVILGTLDGRPIAYKAYSEERVGDIDFGALQKLIDWRGDLSAELRAQLDEFTAWPERLVTSERGVNVGYVMPPIPDRFLLPKSPRFLSDIYWTKVQASTRGFRYYEPPEKLAILGRYLARIEWLHKQGVIVGDIQERNVVFADNRPKYDVFVIDCDSMAAPSIWGTVHPPAAPLRFAWIPEQCALTQDADSARFSLMVACALMENADAWEVDQAQVSHLVRREIADLVSNTMASVAEGRCRQGEGSPILWWEAAKTWPQLVTMNGMYVSTDGNAREPYEPRGPVKVRRVVTVTGGTKHGENGSREVIRAVLAIVAVVALIVILLLTVGKSH